VSFNKQDRDSTDAWQAGRKYAFLYGEVPTSFSTLIRSLLSDQERGTEFSSGSEWQMLRLLQTESMKAPFYFALKTFFPESVENLRGWTLKEFVQVFEPRDAAAFLGLLYLYRRARRLCNAEEFERITEGFHAHLDVGGHVGVAIPNIGFGFGILSLGLPVLARAAFLSHDVKGFTAYRRQCKISKIPHDLEYEYERWGCTHIQIASSLAIAVGFSANAAGALAQGLARDTLSVEKKDRLAYATRICRLWVNALSEGGNEPDIVHNGNFYPTQAALERLLSRCEEIRQNGSGYRWLEKGKDSINREEMPELFT